MRKSPAVATLIGFAAVLMWSTLALLTAASGAVPPFQLIAMAFAIGGGAGFAWLIVRGGLTDLRQPPLAWLHGVGGLFGYHFFYFTALRQAPPAEAGLIAYLWPLLIVLLSAALPGGRLRWNHIVGALLGLFGTVLILTGGRGPEFTGAALPGYGAALACALIWSGYSVTGRTFAAVPTGAVAGFCLATAALSLGAHLAFETTAWPPDAAAWAAVVALGLFPVGLAFYVWDYGIKHGDIAVLGATSYLAPLLSTAILVIAGYAEPRPALAVAAILIAGGGGLAASTVFRHRRAARATEA